MKKKKAPLSKPQKQVKKSKSVEVKSKKRNRKPKENEKKSNKAEKVSYKLTDSYSRIEFRDAWEQLKSKSELHRLILCTMHDDPEVYTLRGRLNKSRVCKILKIKPKDLNMVLNDAQVFLGTPITEKLHKKKKSSKTKKKAIK